MRKIVVTHSMQSPGEMSLDDMKRCVDMGGIIENCYLTTLMGPNAALSWMRGWRHVSIERFAMAIKALGAENNIISTDLGQYRNTTPADGMKAFILALLEKGITQDEIDLMAKKNPARLLGLTA